KRTRSAKPRGAGARPRANINPDVVDLLTARDISPVAISPARGRSAPEYTTEQTLESPGDVHDCATIQTAQTAATSARALRMSFRPCAIRPGLHRYGRSKSFIGLLTRTRYAKFRLCSVSPFEPFPIISQPGPSAVLTTSQSI